MDEEDIILPSDPEEFGDSWDIYDFSENTSSDSDDENPNCSKVITLVVNI